MTDQFSQTDNMNIDAVKRENIDSTKKTATQLEMAINNIEFAKIDGFNSKTLDKQVVFDRFLTYRRRMARLASVQALYLYEIKQKTKQSINQEDLFDAGDNLSATAQTDAENVCNEIFSLYNGTFFTAQEYGWTKRNKQVDEVFAKDIVVVAIIRQKEIDRIISQFLNNKWKIDKLDSVIRAILRCSVAEILLGNNINKAVLSSEYTNIASNFFNGRETGFINGVTDKLYQAAQNLSQQNL